MWYVRSSGTNKNFELRKRIFFILQMHIACSTKRLSMLMQNMLKNILEEILIAFLCV